MPLSQHSDTTFRIECQIEDDTARVVFAGNVDQNNAAAAGKTLEALRKELARVRIGRVRLDIRPLAFLSSAGLKQLVAWITAIAPGSEEHSYPIAIVTDPGLHWQSRSLSALVSLEPEIVSVVEGEPT